MSCCSFVGIYCCVYANVMNSARMQFLVGCYYGAESETSCYNLGVASVSSRGLSRKLGQDQKKWMTGEGEGNSHFRVITRLETLATQATIIKNTDLPLAAKKRQTEVINKLSFQIIGAWELIANWYLRDILCKLNENELVNHENHN